MQGVANTGNAQNVIDLIQYGSTADDFEFNDINSSIVSVLGRPRRVTSRSTRLPLLAAKSKCT